MVIAPAQPAILTKDLTGKGLAIAVGVAPDGTEYLVEPGSPLQEGHAVVLYCAGLGPVSPPVPEGVEKGPEVQQAATSEQRELESVVCLELRFWISVCDGAREEDSCVD